MTTNELRFCLTAMCYQEVKPGHWFKPVGYGLFIFEENIAMFTCFFKSTVGTIGIWNSKRFGNESLGYDTDRHVFLMMLKEEEANSRINVCPESNSHFELGAFDL